jgi:hypothetical protein
LEPCPKQARAQQDARKLKIEPALYQGTTSEAAEKGLNMSEIPE